MTKMRFFELCTSNLVDVGIALENEDIREALRDRDDELVEELINELF